MLQRPANQRRSPRGSLLAAGAVFLAVICCAGPALLAGGILALAGGVLANPVILALSMAILSDAVVYTLRLRNRG